MSAMQTTRTDAPLKPWTFTEALAVVRDQIEWNQHRDQFVVFDPETHPVHVAERERGEREPFHRERPGRILRQPRRVGQCGEQANRVKLTADQVYEIRARYDRGAETLEQIAADYDISWAHVSGIGRGASWSHLPERPSRVAS